MSDRSLHLVCVSSAGYASHPLALGRTVVIGRGRDCHVTIDDPSISRQHARLAIGPRGTLSIIDLASANGTQVRGRPIEPNRPITVRIGESITLGEATLIVQDLSDAVTRRAVLSPERLVAALAERCAEAAATELTFRVATIATREDLSDDELLAVVGPELRGPDLLGTVVRREWVVVLDDVPTGRAMIALRRASEALREAQIRATIGIASWPRDGKTPSALIAAARATATGRQGRAEIVIGAKLAPLLATVDRIARSDLAVLVLGETGVGKEIIATRLHEQSPRAGRPLLKLNCAALSPQLLESELFGHVRGAFTGADHTTPGLLASADGGTVFLDEIGELPLSMQAKLLRVLEDRQVRPIGGLEPRAIDVRFVAATNQRLDDPARFRPDLYFRISGAVVEVPPLRERADEILPLAHLFLREYGERTGSPPPTLSPGAERVLQTYAWPGNIRELRNAIERAAVVAAGDEIEPGAFPVADMRASARITGPMAVAYPSDGPTAVTLGARQPDRQTILDALAAHGGNQHLAAEQLGVHRRTLMRWMDQMKIARPRKGA